jgi:hypothetical protein
VEAKGAAERTNPGCQFSDGLSVSACSGVTSPISPTAQSAPNFELQGDELSRADESALYHHYELNYTPPDTESGRRLARR